MALKKYDSMVVSELIAAFQLLGTFAIAIVLFNIQQSLSHPPVPVAAPTPEKISIQDLDPAFVGELKGALSSLDTAQKMGNQEVAFFMNKVLEKDFSKEEIKSISDEFAAIRSKQIQNAKAAQKNSQAPVQKAPVQKTPVQKAPVQKTPKAPVAQ